MMCELQRCCQILGRLAQASILAQTHVPYKQWLIRFTDWKPSLPQVLFFPLEVCRWDGGCDAFALIFAQCVQESDSLQGPDPFTSGFPRISC
jgi:hypothetical protein